MVDDADEFLTSLPGLFMIDLCTYYKFGSVENSK